MVSDTDIGLATLARALQSPRVQIVMRGSRSPVPPITFACIETSEKQVPEDRCDQAEFVILNLCPDAN